MSTSCKELLSSEENIERMARTLFDIKYGNERLDWNHWGWLAQDAKTWCIEVTRAMVTSLLREDENIKKE